MNKQIDKNEEKLTKKIYKIVWSKYEWEITSERIENQASKSKQNYTYIIC